jgi:hypothetical protein
MKMAEFFPWVFILPMFLAGVWGVYETFFRR